MWLSISLSVASWAAPETLKLGQEGLVVRRGGGEVVIRAVGMPQGAIESRFRVCRVWLEWSGKVQATGLEGCHPDLQDEVKAAMALWDFEFRTTPPRQQEMIELWYVFPDQSSEPVRLFVRPAHGMELVVPPGVELETLPAKIEVMRPLRFPDEASALADLHVTDCEAKVDIAPTGLPTDILVSRCDEVFHDPLEQQLRGWRFQSPQLDGEPFVSGVTMTVRFRRSIVPGEPGTVRFELPQGGVTEEEETIYAEAKDPDAQPLPDHPPVLVVDHRTYAAVQIYEMVWPEVPPADTERSCDVLWVVNSVRQVWAWTEGCDETLRDAVEQASAKWVLAPGEIERGEQTARFRGTMIFPAQGEPLLRIASEDLHDAQLPARVQSYSAPRTLRTVPPRPPIVPPTPSGEPVSCEFDIEVDKRGKPSQISSLSCSAGYDEAAQAALRKWRWIPAQVAGAPVSSRVRVRVRFG